jgi:hypothetical protein
MRLASYSSLLPLSLAVLLFSGCSAAPRLGAADAERAVAQFYQWYVPLAHDSTDAGMRAVRERSAFFPTSLVAALRADSLASARSPGEVVGLDGDPFLNSQDPCERYAPIGTVQRDTQFFVAVRGSGGCASHDAPDVTVEVTAVDGRPVFTNFIYSSKPRDNLTSILGDLAGARRSLRPEKSTYLRM